MSLVFTQLDDCAVSIVSNVRILFIQHNNMASLHGPFSLRSRAFTTFALLNFDICALLQWTSCDPASLAGTSLLA